MRVPIYQIDAFTRRRFSGNPAAVVVFERYPQDAVLQAIAAENNLAETAFLEPAAEGWNLRWFTPAVEVPLCGHATLASAWVVFNKLRPGSERVQFSTRESGVLEVRRAGEGFLMDFPALSCEPAAPPPGFAEILGCAPREVLANARNFVAVFGTAAQVRQLKPDLAAVQKLDRPGLIVTAPGDQSYDCVSRFFIPAGGVPEDPVTGSAHCVLAPFWAARLGKSAIRAYQASARGGELICRVRGDRVELEGQCAFYMEGFIEIDA